MMKNDIRKVAGFIVSFSQKNNIFEDKDALRFSDINEVDENDLTLFKEIYNSLRELCYIHIYADIDRNIEIDQLDLTTFENQQVSFVFTKKNDTNSVLFFTEKGFSSFLIQSNELPESIFIVDDFESFATYSTIISPPCNPLPTNSLGPTDGWNGVIDARKNIRNLSNSYSIISSIPSWLINPDCPCTDSSYYKVFLRESSKKLFCLCANEIFTNQGVTYLEFSCDRKVTMNINSLEMEKLYLNSKIIQHLIIWIFESNNEYETRHTLLNYQIALESISNNNVRLDNLCISLQNAKIAYNYFLRSKSKEMMHSLNNLKKSVSEELSEHNKNTYNIIKNMWRDFVFATISITYDIFTSKNNYKTSNTILIFIATAITISYVISVISELVYQHIVFKNIKTWYPQLYSFLTEKEMENLVHKPIKNIQYSLYIILLIAFILYIAVDCIILRNVIPFLKFIRF